MHDPVAYDVLIVGAGPAGLAAACAAQDRRLVYVVVEKRGLVQSLVEHPQQIQYFSPADEIAVAGVPFPVAGGHRPTREDTLAYFRALAQSRRLNLKLWDEVSGVRTLPDDQFEVVSRRWQTGEPVRRICRTVMVCTGTFQNPRRLDGVPGADLPKVMTRLDDPTPYFGCDVLVVGGGNSAATAAMTLADAGARVALAMRRPPSDFQSHLRPFIVRDVTIMADEKRLTLVTGCVVTEIAAGGVTLARCEYPNAPGPNAETFDLPNDFVFSMIGHTADRTLFDAIGVPLDDDGLPVIDAETAETPVRGIFACGALSKANIILESRRRAVEIVERIKTRVLSGGSVGLDRSDRSD